MNLAELAWPEIAAVAPHTPVVVPVAAMEQHGLHLPLATDSMLLGEVIRRVEPRLQAEVLFCPLQWLGNSHHHLAYAGTLSAGPRTGRATGGQALTFNRCPWRVWGSVPPPCQRHKTRPLAARGKSG